MNLPESGGFRINYACPNCNTPLRIFLGKTEKYCHNCGESIYWGVLQAISVGQSEVLIELDKSNKQYAEIFEDGLLTSINNYNDTHDLKEEIEYCLED